MEDAADKARRERQHKLELAAAGDEPGATVATDPAQPTPSELAAAADTPFDVEASVHDAEHPPPDQTAMPANSDAAAASSSSMPPPLPHARHWTLPGLGQRRR